MNASKSLGIGVCAMLATACLFSPDYQVGSCAVRCESVCPTGLSCRQGYCVDPGFSGGCKGSREATSPVAVATGNETEAGEAPDVGTSETGHRDAGNSPHLDATPTASGDVQDARASTSSGAANVLRITSPRLLPEACSGQLYEYDFEAAGGAGYYTWTDVGGLSLPDWLTLSPNGHIMGVPPLDAEQDTQLTVRVASGVLDNPVQSQVQLTVRRSCKFGFIGTRGNRARMMLGDARRARTPEQFEPRDITVDFSDELEVRAFNFSPDGRALAFAVGTEADSQLRSLWVSGITELEGALPLAEVLSMVGQRTIMDFVWSQESDRIIVLTRTASGPPYELHVVTLAGTAQPTELVSEAFPLDWSELFRIEDRVCYFNINGERVCASPDEPSGASNQAVDSVAVLDDAELVQWVASGHFQGVFSKDMASDPFELMLLYLDGVKQSRSLHVQAIIDPSVKLLAQPGTKAQRTAERPEVGIWALSEGLNTYGDAIVPPAAVTNCKVVVAWQPQGNALACDTDDTLRVATISGTETAIDERFVDNGALGKAYSLARTFNYGTTRYFYDTADQGLMMVDLTAQRWSATPLTNHDPSERVAFQGLLDGRMLLQLGTNMKLMDPETGELRSLNGSATMVMTPACQDEFQLGGPYEWCGSPVTSKVFSASSELQVLLFPNQQRELFLVDLSAGASSGPVLVSDATVDCSMTRREGGRPEHLAIGCEQEIKWAP